MSLNVHFLSDSMWRNLDATLADISYTEYDSVHFVPGCQISKISDLAMKYCTESHLIVVNAGINNVLNGYSVAQCLHEYDQCYKAVTTHCKSAHLAFVSLSHVADNKYTKTDTSAETNLLIDDLNCQLKLYCDERDKMHFIDVRRYLSNRFDDDSECRIERRYLALDGLHYSRCGIMQIACALVQELHALKDTVVEMTQEPIISQEYIADDDDAWPELPAPEVKARIHPASYPGQKFVTVNVVSHTCTVTCKTVERVTSNTGTVTRSSVVRQKPTIKQYVDVAVKRHRCNHRQTGSDVVRTKENYVRPVSFVDQNKFSVLYSDDLDDNNDDMDLNRVQCDSRAFWSDARKEKSKSRVYCTNVVRRTTQRVQVGEETTKNKSSLCTNVRRTVTFHKIKSVDCCIQHTSQMFSERRIADDTETSFSRLRLQLTSHPA